MFTNHCLVLECKASSLAKEHTHKDRGDVSELLRAHLVLLGCLLCQFPVAIFIPENKKN